MSEPLTLRPVAVDDAESMTAVLADASLYRFTGGEPPAAAQLARQYAAQVRGASADGSEVWVNLLVLLGGQTIGYVQATIPQGDDVAEIAWVIGRAWQGQGHSQRAVRLLAQDLVGRGVRRLIAHIHPDHVASQRVAESIGLSATEVIVDGEVRWTGAAPVGSA